MPHRRLAETRHVVHRGPVVALAMTPALMGALLAAAAHGELPALRARAAREA